MGRVVFADNGQGISGLDLHVVDVYPIPDNDLGKTQTDTNGDFELLYAPEAYSRWESGRSPNVRVRIYGPVQRQLFDQTFESVSDTILDLGTIAIHSNNVGEQDPANDPASEAWLVTNATLDLLNGTPVNLSQDNTFVPLIDGPELFTRVNDAVKGSTSSINFMNLNFRIASDLKTMRKKDQLEDHLITKFTPDPPVVGQRVAGNRYKSL